MEIIRSVPNKHLACCLLLALTVFGSQLLLPPSIANSVDPSTAQDDDAAEIEIQKGTDLLRQRRFDDALKSFKRANDMRGKNCAQCLYGMAQAYYAMEAHKNAAETADKN